MNCHYCTKISAIDHGYSNTPAKHYLGPAAPRCSKHCRYICGKCGESDHFMRMTTVAMPFLALALIVTKNAIISILLAFILLNILTLATSQSPTQIALCLGLPILVVGTHLYRFGAQLMPPLERNAGFTSPVWSENALVR